MTARESRTAGVHGSTSDVVVHALVPAALLLAYVAPIPYETFLYRPGQSGVGDAYWSTLGHADLAHLLTNLFGYAVLATTAFALLGRRQRRRYYVLFAATLLAAPPLTAGLLELYVRSTPAPPGDSPGGAGFSIVTAALLALLAVAIALHQRRTLERSLPPALVGLSLFSLAAAVPAARVSGPGVVPAVLVGIGGAYLLVAAWLLAGHIDREGASMTVALQFSAVVIFLGSTVDLFLLENRAWVGHFLGFLSGTAVVTLVVAVQWLRSVRRSRRN